MLHPSNRLYPQFKITRNNPAAVGLTYEMHPLIYSLTQREVLIKYTDMLGSVGS